MASKWQGEAKRWRVRAKSDDGLTVTLGCHDTEAAAKADADKFIKEGFYRDVKVERIATAADSPTQEATGSTGA